MEYLMVAILLQPDIKTPHMALTVHVDIVERTGLAIPKILFFPFLSDNTLAIILELKKKKKMETKLTALFQETEYKESEM